MGSDVLRVRVRDVGLKGRLGSVVERYEESFEGGLE
jgi:hypothetical protein